MMSMKRTTLQRMRRGLRGDDSALSRLADRLDALLGPLGRISPDPRSMTPRSDVLVIGGGVVGLSVAYQLTP